MRVYLSSKDAVTPAALEVLKHVKDQTIPNVPLEFAPVTDNMPPNATVLALGAYQRQGSERVVAAPSVAQLLTKADIVTRLGTAFRLLVDPPELPPMEYTIIWDRTDAVDFISSLTDREIVVDLETSGDVSVDMAEPSRIIAVAFTGGGMNFVIPEELCTDPFVVGALCHMLENNRMVAVNGKFDLKYFDADTNFYFDVQLAHYALYPAAGEHGLKPMAKRFFGADDWDVPGKVHTKGATYKEPWRDEETGAWADARKYSSGSGFERIPRDMLYEYAAYDVYYTWHLKELMQEYISDDPDAQKLLPHLMKLSDMFMGVEKRGIHLDVDYLEQLSKELHVEKIAAELELNEIAGREINPRSPKQVAEYFAGIGTKLKSTNEATMQKLIEADPESLAGVFAEQLLVCRGLAKTLGTYVDGYRNQAIDGKVYPGYKLIASTTGRLGGAGASMLTIPRDKRLKRMVTSSGPGRVVIGADLSQAELRVMAMESLDEWLISAFQPGAPDFFDNLLGQAYPKQNWPALNAAVKAHEATEAEANFYNGKRASMKGVVYGCVPLSTKILTRRGWLGHDEVMPGDETPGLDAATGESRWCKITDVHHYEPQQLYRYGHNNWNFEVTDGHKWAVQKRRRHTDQPYGFPAVLKETHSIVKDDRIVVAAECEGDNDEYLTDTEVRVLSWILSDGCIIRPERGGKSQGRDFRRHGIIAAIQQAKPEYVQEIKELLADIPHRVDTRPGVNYETAYNFALPTDYIRPLWDKAGMGVINKSQVTQVVDFVLSLSSRQRHIFLEVFCKAEGYYNKLGTWTIVQKAGEKLDAIVTCAQLCGYRTSITLHEKGTDCWNVYLNTKQEVGVNTATMIPTEIAPVWCVTTELGTWTARDGHRVAITGNTSFGRGTPAIAGALKIPIWEAQTLVDAFVRPGSLFAMWREDITKRALDGAEIVNKFGRHFQSELVTKKNQQSVINSALSFMSQSTGNDICLDAALAVDKQLGQYNAHLMGTIHDAIIVDGPVESAEAIGEMLVRELKAAGVRTYGTTVPFDSDWGFGADLSQY